MVADQNLSDTEPATAEPAPDYPSKGRRSFASVRRDLDNEELKSPGVQKMLLDDVERLEREVSELKGFRDQFYDEAKKCAVLSEKRKLYIGIEVVHAACLSIGSVAISYAIAFWSTEKSGSGLALGGGVVLIAAALLAKWLQR